jgi:membrane protease YdiL (CAAX protease family)
MPDEPGPPDSADFERPPLQAGEHVESAAIQVKPGADGLPVLDVIAAEAPAGQAEAAAAPPGQRGWSIATPRRPRPGFWEAALWTMVYGVVLQIVVMLGVGVVALLVQLAMSDRPAVDLARFGQPNFAQTEQFRSFNALFQQMFLVSYPLTGTLLGLATIRLSAGQDWPRRVGFRRPGWLHLVLALAAVPALVILSDGVYRLALLTNMPSFHVIEELNRMLSGWPWAFGVFAIGLLPGIAEEVWCRGFLGRGLVGRYGYVRGVLLTSFFFGVMHFDPPHATAAFFMGICLQCAYLVSRSLWIPILLHFLNNSASALAATAWKDTAFGRALDEPPTILYAPALLLGLVVAWAFYRSRGRLVTTTGVEEWRPAFPGVEWPPPGSATRVQSGWPGWLSLACVIAALGLFAAVLVLAIQN